MNESIVRISTQDENKLDCSYAIITKDNSSVVIILRASECGIFDYEKLKSEDFNFEYLLLKHYENDSVAYKDFLKLIGKMCKKDKNSKYFSKHKDEDNRMVVNADGAWMITDDELNSYEERYNVFMNCVLNSRNNM